MPRFGRRRPGPTTPKTPRLARTRAQLVPLPTKVAATEGPRGGRVKVAPIQPEAMPPWFVARYRLATLPEYLTFWALRDRLHLVQDADFSYQVPELGEFIRDVGSTIVDFVVWSPTPPLALPVQGLYWHPLTGPRYAADISIFSRLKQQKGWDVIPLDEDDLRRDAFYTVREAVLSRRDLSRYVGQF